MPVPERGFNDGAEPVNIPERLAEWQTAGDERLWRFILSPEFGERLDLQRLTREFVGRMETDLGKSLEWVAIPHFNTEHPHVHLAVRGRDVRLDRDYVRHGLRAVAEDLCTRQLGYRTTIDAEYARNREINRPYLTSLDRSISQAANELTSSNSWLIRSDFESILRSMKCGRDRQKTLADRRSLRHDQHIRSDRQHLAAGSGRNSQLKPIPRLHFVTVDHRKLDRMAKTKAEQVRVGPT